MVIQVTLEIQQMYLQRQMIITHSWVGADIRDTLVGSRSAWNALKIATLEDRIARRLLRLKMYFNGIDSASRELFGRIEADIRCGKTERCAYGIAVFHHTRNTIGIAQQAVDLVYLCRSHEFADTR